tara:strand:+ start:1963 stop:2181 length:219 start_codon:yes stop_codon:yes gene_type:complete
MYIVLKDLMLKGKRFAASEILDNISDDDAKKLKAMGRIEPVSVAPEVKVADRAVGLDEETKPKQRSVKKKPK